MKKTKTLVIKSSPSTVVVISLCEFTSCRGRVLQTGVAPKLIQTDYSDPIALGLI